MPFILGCGDKFDLATLGNIKGTTNTGDTLYVQLSPNPKIAEPGWEGFTNPTAILMGKEPFIYVCDANSIFMINLAGQRLGELNLKKFNITNPVSITQDNRFNLIICAKLDTMGYLYSAVYKINLFAVNHEIANANWPKRILPVDGEFTYKQRSINYNAVASFSDNSYYVARTGPSNSDISLGFDNALMIYDKDDMHITEVANFSDPVSGTVTPNGINSMLPFPKKNNLDLIVTFKTVFANFKTVWFHYTVNSQGDPAYASQFSPSSVKFMTPDRFKNPTGTCLSSYEDIFVADGGKDSVFKFSKYGDEMQSFGGSTVFARPVGVAFFDKTLYVLDAGTHPDSVGTFPKVPAKIKRFKLSTEIQ